MRLLISGGAGYIGSTVAADLLAAGHAVTVADNFSRGHRKAVPEGAEVVAADLADTDAVEALFGTGGFDAVLHFAALIEAGESMQKPAIYFRQNTFHALNLLEAAIGAGVRQFVFSSTAALYGNPERLPIAEDAPLQPVNAYGESKLLVERMLEWFHRIHGLRYASLRYFNAAGARDRDHGEDHQPESHLIPLTLRVALGQRDAIRIFGDDYDTPDGTCVRDYIHVSDLASAHVLALEALAGRDRLIYNLGNGTGYSVREVIEAARRVTGHPIPAVLEARRPGDPAVLVASSEKIRCELGWQPRRPGIDEIIASAWEWHRRYPRGYADR